MPCIKFRFIIMVPEAGVKFNMRQCTHTLTHPEFCIPFTKVGRNSACVQCKKEMYVRHHSQKETFKFRNSMWNSDECSHSFIQVIIVACLMLLCYIHFKTVNDRSPWYNSVSVSPHVLFCHLISIRAFIFRLSVKYSNLEIVNAGNEEGRRSRRISLSTYER